MRLAAIALITILLAGGAGAAVADFDGDGLSNSEELQGETGYLDADSDGDGLDDAAELEAGTDPMVADTDGDGLGDHAELEEYGTDPVEIDTDDDGITDQEELDRGLDPVEADTDGDGLDDGQEIEEHGTDPTTTDTDGDGLADAREVELGTDPLESDTDGDGLDDGTEVANDLDPVDADMDTDRLEDGAELDIGTDPEVRDTDGDGFTDGQEVHLTDTLPDADPLATDIYVEVDSQEGERIDREAYGRIESAFADAPVNDGEGIDVHFLFSDATVPSCGCAVAWSDTGDGTFPNYAAEHFDHYHQGYHYLLVVNEIKEGDDTPPGFFVAGYGSDGYMMVQADTDGAGSTLLHEFGHSLGLGPDDFDGIDSDEYSLNEYPSVLNYNAPDTYYQLSGSETFDDWEWIEEQGHRPSTSDLPEPSG